MTDAPVFSLARHRELVAAAVERTRREERERCAQAIEINANTIGGAVGAALDEIARQVREALPPKPIEPSGADRIAEQQRLDSERIERERAELRRKVDAGEWDPNVDPPLGADMLPAEGREYSDDMSAAALVRGRRLPPPPGLD